MIQLGISAFYHDSAACLIKDGKILGAVEEERFTGVKHDMRFPINSIKWLLRDNNVSLKDVNEVCWYENPKLKKDRVLKIFNKNFFKTLPLRFRFLKEYKYNNPSKVIKENLGIELPVKFVEHHHSHAAFAFFTSPYIESAVLTVDGVGEWETITIWHGSYRKLDKKASFNFPNSLGMFYSTFTSYIGFRPNEGEYKVMGLAPYGNSEKYYSKLINLFEGFEINQKYFTWEYSDRIMFNLELAKYLQVIPRLPEDEITQDHKDLAAAVQRVYTQKFRELVSLAKQLTGSTNLCIGGGSAYNGVANQTAYSIFKSVYIPFAPSDAGSCIGACLVNCSDPRQIISPYLGPDYSDFQVKFILSRYKNKVRWFKLSDDKLIQKTAQILHQQKIVGWFQGRMEFGARALGNRSILASPRDPQMREKLNLVIKKREGFRPFAPSVTLEQASKWFDIKEPVPFMNIVTKAKKVNRTIPFQAATHVDGTCRVQTVTKESNPRYHALLTEFGRIDGAQVLLNTSFNLKDETITMTPVQALDRFLNSKINYLIINNYLIQKL